MAFNVLVDLKSTDVNWAEINKKLLNVSEGLIEFFPIPESSINPNNYIGISVVKKDLSARTKEAFKNIVIFFLSKNSEVTELYSFHKFSFENIDILTDKFL